VTSAKGSTATIVRAWRGRASRENPAAYAEHFAATVVPELERVDGFLGASLLRHDQADAIEFLVLTRWASMDAIRAFAGDDVNKAVVEPAAAAALVDFDRMVQHYEVVQEVSRSSRSGAQADAVR
jgi:heme-degrading monooxygenase HmoA